MWLACYTQEEIAEEVGCDQKTATNVIDDFRKNGDLADFPKSEQADASHATDFEVPIYNVWKQEGVGQVLSRSGKFAA
jgi:predicted transcriptional regulator